MAESENHVFICCERGDLAGWMEASWLADQGLDIWCEDGVNPGNPEWDDCADAILAASHCVFLVTNAFIDSKGAINKLRFALGGKAPCMALILEPVRPDNEVADLISRCDRLEKRHLDTSAYAQQLGDWLDATLHPPPAPAQAQNGRAQSYTVGQWRVYPQMLRIAAGEESKTLDRKIFDVLDLLVRRAPEVVTIEEFLQDVWAGSIVEDNSLHRAISKLRKAFRDDPRTPQYIETIPRSGYRLVATVAAEPEQVLPDVRPASDGVQLHGINLCLQIGTGHIGDAPETGGLARALMLELQARLHDDRWRLMNRLPGNESRPSLVLGLDVHVLGDAMRVYISLSRHESGEILCTRAATTPVPASPDDLGQIAANWQQELLPMLTEHLT